MTVVVVPIVEGEGEVAAVPILLRRLCAWLTPENQVEVSKPIRVRRDRFLNREGEFSRTLLLAADKARAEGWVLVLLDADDDCPKELGASILERARNIASHRQISVVLAKREFEAWFIAAADSLRGRRGLDDGLTSPPDPEAMRGAKEWLDKRMSGKRYREVMDQPALASQFDLQQARDASRSFRKLCKEFAGAVRT